MATFIQRYLEPADRLGEILFGLIMALGFTGAVRLGVEDADNRTLFISILGCNIAWAIVDGVMYVLTALFEQGRKALLVRDVRAAPSESRPGVGRKRVRRPAGIAADDRPTWALYRSVLTAVSQAEREPPVRRDYLLGSRRRPDHVQPHC
jgi:hypothetical protein